MDGFDEFILKIMGLKGDWIKCPKCRGYGNYFDEKSKSYWK